MVLKIQSNDSLIVKCSHCKGILSADSFETHECDLPLKDVKRILVVYFQDDSINGEKIITGKGVDGILYSFVVAPRKALPLIEAIRRKKTCWESDEEETESKTVKFIYVNAASLSLRGPGTVFINLMRIKCRFCAH